MKSVLQALRERGFIEQVTSDELDKVLEKPATLYVGFDPTADSLHLGNLLGIMALAWFQKAGHKVVVVLGGATGRIGDPSGKSVERPLLADATIEFNVIRLGQFFERILKKPLVVNNNDWLGNYPLVSFLRDVGKQFRIGTMLSKEMVRTRLESEEGISFTEFTYQILQGYDFVHLNRKHGVTVQLGGSDQWGNIVSGIELNRKMGGGSLYGITWPLLTRSDGKKFGKSEEGAIWLEADRLSPYHLYQYLIRLPDADVGKCLRLLTFLPMEEIRALETSAEPNCAQRKLAEEVTRFIHGEEGVQAALKVTQGLAPGKEAELTYEALRELEKELPPVTFPKKEVIGARFSEIMARAGLVTSKGEATRLIQQGGAYANNAKITEINALIAATDLIEGRYLLLSAGKKKRLLIRVD